MGAMDSYVSVRKKTTRRERKLRRKKTNGIDLWRDFRCLFLSLLSASLARVPSARSQTALAFPLRASVLYCSLPWRSI